MRYTFSWISWTSDRERTELTRTYDVDSVTDAAQAFCCDFTLTPDTWGHVRIQAADTIGAEPERMLQNWERDGFNEVSDGYLSNMAAGWTNEINRLAHRPEYCNHPQWMVRCFHCGAEYEARIHEGQYGRYVQCPQCRKTMGRYTKRFNKQVIGLARVCGAQLEARVNQNGCSYAGCPSCDPQGGYERKTIGVLVGYRD